MKTIYLKYNISYGIHSVRRAVAADWDTCL